MGYIAENYFNSELQKINVKKQKLQMNGEAVVVKGTLKELSSHRISFPDIVWLTLHTILKKKVANEWRGSSSKGYIERMVITQDLIS